MTINNNIVVQILDIHLLEGRKKRKKGRPMFVKFLPNQIDVIYFYCIKKSKNSTKIY